MPLFHTSQLVPFWLYVLDTVVVGIVDVKKEVCMSIAPPTANPRLVIPTAEASAIRLSDVLGALSYALDITEGQPEGHALRACIIGMQIAEEIGLAPSQRSALFYALLLKDLGCSSNAARVCSLLGSDDIAAKQDVKLTDWTKLHEAARWGLKNAAYGQGMIEKAIQVARAGLQGGPFAANAIFAVRCDRGASIASMIGMPEETSDAIRALDEHWDGSGLPNKLKGESIPLLARICCLAQTFDIFMVAYGLEAAYHVVRGRSGTWFDPALVDALERIHEDIGFWYALEHGSLENQIARLEPHDYIMHADAHQLDRIAEGFAQVVDAKSPWTYRHSSSVATFAIGIAETMGMPWADQHTLWRAALLHDIGKLGVSNRILDKNGKLTDDELASIHAHPAHTARILKRIPAFTPLVEIAASHHERLDGTGYHRHLHAEDLSPLARILAVADVGDALEADRPYRKGMQQDELMRVLQREADVRLWGEAVDAFELVLRMRPR